MSDLDKEIAELEKKTSKLKKLKEMFPDLKQDIDRWKNVRYSSKSVNSKANKVEIRHTCGCCKDAGLIACPYIETEMGPVYSDPARFHIGEREPYTYTDQPNDQWATILTKEGIGHEVLDQINVHFEYEASKYKDFYDNNQTEDDDV